MALDDQAPRHARPGAPIATPAGASPEDEDLFDFPIVEMKLETAPAAKAEARVESAPAARAAVAPAVRAAVAPADVGRAAPAAPLRARKPVYGQSSTLGIVDERAPGAPHAASAPHPIARAASAVAAAAAEQDEPNDAAQPAPKRALIARTPRVVWIAALTLFSLNSAGFFVLWRSNSSFHSAVDGMRDELAVAAHDMHVASSRTLSDPVPVAARPVLPARDTEGAPAPRVPSFEETAVELARREIDLGRYAAARIRLYRLLAVADRIDPVLRDDVEARASFLIGESYAAALERRLPERRQEVPR